MTSYEQLHHVYGTYGIDDYLLVRESAGEKIHQTFRQSRGDSAAVDFNRVAIKSYLLFVSFCDCVTHCGTLHAEPITSF